MTALHYNPRTGIFTWLVKIRTGRNKAFMVAKPGTRAGFSAESTGYRYLSLGGFRRAEHQFAWFYMTGRWPRGDMDHINGNRTDNRWSNLRLATRSVNMQNLKGPHKDNTTGFLGIERKRKKFAARICIDGKRLNLGVFKTPALAHAEYLRKKRLIHEGNTL